MDLSLEALIHGLQQEIGMGQNLFPQHSGRSPGVNPQPNSQNKPKLQVLFQVLSHLLPV